MCCSDTIKVQFDRVRINTFTIGIILNPPYNLGLGLSIYITIWRHIKDTWNALGEIIKDTQEICFGIDPEASRIHGDSVVSRFLYG